MAGLVIPGRLFKDSVILRTHLECRHEESCDTTFSETLRNDALAVEYCQARLLGSHCHLFCVQTSCVSVEVLLGM